MPADGKKINRHLIDLDGHFPDSLNGICMKVPSRCFRDLDGFRNRLHHSRLIIRPHDGSEPRAVINDSFGEIVKPQPTVTVDPHSLNIKAHGFHRLGRTKYGAVLDRADDNAGVLASDHTGEGLDGHIV